MLLFAGQKSVIILLFAKPAILFPSGGKKMSYDVAIIGAGVSGALVARELCRYNIKVALVEKCLTWQWAQQKQTAPLFTRVSTQCPVLSKQNSMLRVRQQCPLCARLFMSRSSPSALMVVAFSNEELETLEELKARAKRTEFPDSR